MPSRFNQGNLCLSFSAENSSTSAPRYLYIKNTDIEQVPRYLSEITAEED